MSGIMTYIRGREIQKKKTERHSKIWNKQNRTQGEGVGGIGWSWPGSYFGGKSGCGY